MVGRAKQKPAFTIVEVIAGIALTTGMLLSLTVLIDALLVMNDRARDLTLANAIVENKVETLRSLAYAQLQDGTTDFSDELPQSLAPPRSAEYEISTSGASASMKQVDFTITYEDHGRARTLTYRTYVGQLGVGE